MSAVYQSWPNPRIKMVLWLTPNFLSFFATLSVSRWLTLFKKNQTSYDHFSYLPRDLPWLIFCCRSHGRKPDYLVAEDACNIIHCTLSMLFFIYWSKTTDNRYCERWLTKGTFICFFNIEGTHTFEHTLFIIESIQCALTMLRKHSQRKSSRSHQVSWR